MNHSRIQTFAAATFLVVAVCAIPLKAEAADKQFRLVCQTYFRPAVTVPLGKVKQLELDISIPPGKSLVPAPVQETL